jgi:hypothetical protein
LSIARRKSGTTVACPTCRWPVLVPSADDPGELKTEALTGSGGNGVAVRAKAAPPKPKSVPPAVAPPPPAAAPAPSPVDLENLPLFERDDFVRMLEPPSREADPEPTKPEPSKPAPPTGILILPSTATVLVAAVVVLLALAFAAGFLVGSR